MKTLYIGIEDIINVEQNADVTLSGNIDTIKWIRILKGKHKIVYSKIAIFDVSFFITESQYINNNSVLKLKKISNVNTIFEIKYNNTYKNIISEFKDIISLPSRKWYNLSSGIFIVETTDWNKIHCYDFPKSTITIGYFYKLVKNKDFSEYFYLSLRRYWEYKKDMYESSLLYIKKELEITQKKIDSLSNRGIESENIFKRYPLYESYAFIIVDFEEIIDIISNLLKNETPESVYKRLNKVVNIFGNIIGRKKEKLNIIKKIITFSRDYTTRTIGCNGIWLTGSSGVGKTFFAKMISDIYTSLGFLIKNVIINATRADLVAPYVGQTSAKVKSICHQGIEGVIFIDEAYSLSGDSKIDYGTHVITELVAFLGNPIGDVEIIMAGYRDKMDELYNSNEGIERRFPNVYHLDNFNIRNLVTILCKNIHVQRNRINR